MSLPVEVHSFAIDSPLGMLSGLCTRQHFFALTFHDFPAILQKTAKRLPEAKKGSPAFVEQLAGELEEFFGGKRAQFRVPIELYGSEFQKNVWRAVQTIPYGSTTTYAHIAAQLGRPNGTRAVANAVAANPLLILIPCHRVIGSDGRLRGFSGGIENKRALLELEGQTQFSI
jgi:O-6-methylguanine DNA methyltransferase